jgi:hypothetical protein
VVEWRQEREWRLALRGVQTLSKLRPLWKGRRSSPVRLGRIRILRALKLINVDVGFECRQSIPNTLGRFSLPTPLMLKVAYWRSPTTSSLGYTAASGLLSAAHLRDDVLTTKHSPYAIQVVRERRASFGSPTNLLSLLGRPLRAIGTIAQ